MTEPVNELEQAAGYPKIQVGSTIHGDLWVFRGESGKDLDETFDGLAEHADGILSNFSNFKSAAVAKGVFTGPTNTAANSTPAAQSGPPNSNGVPRCAHGEMKDLADKGYRSRYYCPAPRGQKQCPPQN